MGEKEGYIVEERDEGSYRLGYTLGPCQDPSRE